MAHKAGQAPLDTPEGRNQDLDQGKTGRHQSGCEKRLKGQTHPGPGEIVGHQQDNGKQPELVDGRQAEFRLR